MRKLSRNERYRMMGLTPHTRKHAFMLVEAHPNLVLTSGRRSHITNRRVGGSPRSFHLLGRACDWTGPLFDLQRAAETAWRQRVNGSCTGPEEVLLEDSGEPNQHLHTAW